MMHITQILELCSNGRAMQLGGKVSAVSVTAQNTFSTAVALRGKFNVSASGFGTATVSLQRTFDGSTWKTRKTYTADVEEVLEEPEAGVQYRIGVATGAYTSGTLLLRISQ